MSNINKIQVGQDIYDVEDSNAIHNASKIYFAYINNRISFNTTLNESFVTPIISALQDAYDNGAETLVVRFAGDSNTEVRAPQFIYNYISLQSLTNGNHLCQFIPLCNSFSRYGQGDSAPHKLEIFDGYFNVGFNYTDGTFSYTNSYTSGSFCTYPSRNINYWNAWVNVLQTNNTSSFTPTGDYNPSTKLYTDKTHYENMTGYDASKTQVLKNVNGTLTWVDE